MYSGDSTVRTGTTMSLAIVLARGDGAFRRDEAGGVAAPPRGRGHRAALRISRVGQWSPDQRAREVGVGGGIEASIEDRWRGE
jgi:hypothetical protein